MSKAPEDPTGSSSIGHSNWGGASGLGVLVDNIDKESGTHASERFKKGNETLEISLFCFKQYRGQYDSSSVAYRDNSKSEQDFKLQVQTQSKSDRIRSKSSNQIE